MRWKLIFLLSLFGLAMALATVYLLPSRLEPMCWPVIFLASAFMIARRAPGRYFLHGFLVGLTNWVWVASAHVILAGPYMARHAQPAISLPVVPVVGPILGAMRRYDLPVPGLSGLVIGLLAWAASKIPNRRGAPNPS